MPRYLKDCGEHQPHPGPLTPIMDAIEEAERKQTMATIGLSPAYGRDYRSKKAVLADLRDNKDFVLTDFHGPLAQWCNRPASPQDLAQEGYSVSVRYARMTKQAIFSVKEYRQ